MRHVCPQLAKADLRLIWSEAGFDPELDSDCRRQSIPRIEPPHNRMPQIIRQRCTGPGRHHVGTPGDITSECPGDFVEIRTLEERTYPVATYLSKGVRS